MKSTICSVFILSFLLSTVQCLPADKEKPLPAVPVETQTNAAAALNSAMSHYLPAGVNVTHPLSFVPGGDCFNAQEMALRAVRTALKVQLAPANAATFGAVYMILDKVIPLPPSPLDKIENAGNVNPLGMAGKAADFLVPEYSAYIKGSVGNATGYVTGAVGSAAGAVGGAASSAFGAVTSLG